MELQRLKKDIFDDFDEQIALVNFAYELFQQDERFKHYSYVSEFAQVFWQRFFENPRVVREQVEFLSHNPFAKDEYILDLLNETASAIA
jgi:hypothetical protein